MLKNVWKRLKGLGKMAQSKKQTKKEILKFILAHPIKSAKVLIAMRKANDIELVAVWYYASEELKRRGLK